MHHGTPLISTIVAGLVLAYIFGMIANRLRLPPLVGYLFAGVLVGPHTPGFVADQALGAELAELGVILLMFGVGLHFSLKDLMSVRALAIPGAIAQIAVATALGAGLGTLMGWSLGGSLLFGLALSVASTVVLLKALQDRRLIESERGRIAVGWLIVEDLAMVLALVLVPAIASLNGVDTGVHDPFVSFVERIVNAPVGIWGVLAITLVKVAAFVGFMLIVGRRLIPWALHLTAHTGSRELFRLAVLAIALGVALGSAVLFGVSLALGAFFAGMILSESELSHRAANETLPLRDAFAVLFFVSVGMLFDPTIIITNPLPVLATVFIIVVGKSIAAFGIVLLFRRPVATALTISASLAQIGEFSFILASMGVSLAILPQEGQDLILAGALISIVLNPIVFFLLERMRPKLETRYGRPVAAAAAGAGDVRVEPGEFATVSQGPATSDIPREAGIERGAPGPDDDLHEPLTISGHAVLVGYGQVGRIVADGLKTVGREVVVIEDSDHDVAAARAAGLEVIYGNAASQDVLKLANLGGAKNLLVAISNAFEAGSVVESGRKLNPEISIVARAYSEEEETFLRGLGASVVIRGEREIGKGILALLNSGDEKPGPVTPEPEEPKLPPTDNILAQVAGTALMVQPIAEVVEIVRPEAREVEVLHAPTVIELPPPAVKEPEAAAVPLAEVVEIEQAEVVGEDDTPSIGEPPPAIDEVVVVAPAPAEPVAPKVEEAVISEPVVDVEPSTLVASDLPVVGPVEPVTPAVPEARVEPEVSVMPDEPPARAEVGSDPEPAVQDAPETPQTVAENGENGDSAGEKPAAADDETDADPAKTETPDIPVVKPEPRD